jgi:hypothetical protein
MPVSDTKSENVVLPHEYAQPDLVEATVGQFVKPAQDSEPVMNAAFARRRTA